MITEVGWRFSDSVTQEISPLSGEESGGGCDKCVPRPARDAGPHIRVQQSHPVLWLNALGGAYRGPLPQMYTHLRFRKWRSQVLTQWQRTTELPVFRFKGHDPASVRRRVVLYYGPLVIAIVYLFSMLHFGLPSAPMDPSRETTFRGCRRGPQYAMTTLSPVNELLAQQFHAEGEAESQEPLRQLEAGQEGSQTQEKFYYFQGLYVPAVEPPKNRFQGRGIVVTASGQISGQAIGAYVTVYILRKVLKCDLPIEVFFVGPRETFSGKLQAKLRELGNVKILSLPAVLRKDTFFRDQLKHLHVPDRRLRSYAAKPYAVYASSFEEVLLFDAGIIPFVDPSVFFSFTGYTDYGYQLFRDYRELDKKSWSFVGHEFCADVNEIHGALGGTEADSSCIIINKLKAWDSLLVTVAMNGPLQPFTYNRLNGDKDTWVLAASITYQNFSTGDTTPGYFMRAAPPELALVDPSFQSRAQTLRGHVQFLRHPSFRGGVMPLYLNNQRLNMTEYPQIRERLSFGLWEDYGYPFCGWRTINGLLKPLPEVFQVLDAVAPALAQVDAQDECLCKWFRCRWPAPFTPDWPYWIFRH